MQGPIIVSWKWIICYSQSKFTGSTNSIGSGNLDWRLRPQKITRHCGETGPISLLFLVTDPRGPPYVKILSPLSLSLYRSIYLMAAGAAAASFPYRWVVLCAPPLCVLPILIRWIGGSGSLLFYWMPPLLSFFPVSGFTYSSSLSLYIYMYWRYCAGGYIRRDSFMYREKKMGGKKTSVL